MDRQYDLIVVGTGVASRIPADDLKAVLFAYPTVASDIPFML